MATRKDQVQISIAFLTDESKEYAKLINTNQEFIADIQKAKKEGKDLSQVIRDMAASGQSISKIPLDKVAPAQLVTRAQQLKQVLDLIPASTPEYALLAAEYKKINDLLAEQRARTKGVAEAMATSKAEMGSFTQQASTFQRIWQGALSVFGGFSLAGIGQQVLSYGKQLFGLSVGMDSLANKTRTVFGEAEALVRAFAEQNARSIGLAKRQYLDLATAVGDLLTPMGFTQETAAKLSVELVNMGGVLAEWTGGKVSGAEATEILNKALLGERDALNRLGIDIKDSLIQDELKRKGLSDLTGQSLRQAEALVTLEQITKQSSNATAAFANNADSLVRKKAEWTARTAELSETLSKVLAPVFGFFIDLGNKAITMLTSLSQGASELFQGNFTKAIDYFTKGYSMDDIAAKVTQSQPVAEGVMQKAGSGLATALGAGFDKEFDRLKKDGERDSKSFAELRKKQLQAALQEVDIFYAKEELATLKQKNDGIIRDEITFGNVMLILQEQQLEAQLGVYKRYGQEQTKEALDLQKKLLEIQGARNQTRPANFDTLPGRSPGPVSSQGSAIGNIEALSQAAGASEESVLQDKFARIVDMEQEHELRIAEIRRNAAAERMRMLLDAGLSETDAYRKAHDEKTKADEDYNKKKIENEKRTAELKREVEQAGITATADVFAVAVELLSQDEKARKKNAAAIKAFQTAQVITAGVLEVQKIWATVASYPPPLNAIIGGLLTGVAVARTGIAIGKINQAKFAGGGFTGPGLGIVPDSTGHRPVGVVHAHEWVSPPWMTQHPVFGAQIAALESVRQRGFADGGFATTPTVNVVPGAAAGSAAAMSIEGLSALAVEFRQFRQEVSGWQGRIRVAYTDIEDVGAELGAVRVDASL